MKTPDLDAMLAMVQRMSCPMMVPASEWSQGQKAAAELQAWKADIEARLAALEAAKTGA